MAPSSTDKFIPLSRPCPANWCSFRKSLWELSLTSPALSGTWYHNGRKMLGCSWAQAVAIKALWGHLPLRNMSGREVVPQWTDTSILFPGPVLTQCKQQMGLIESGNYHMPFYVLIFQMLWTETKLIIRYDSGFVYTMLSTPDLEVHKCGKA